jgi:hypothetical protein
MYRNFITNEHCGAKFMLEFSINERRATWLTERRCPSSAQMVDVEVHFNRLNAG